MFLCISISVFSQSKISIGLSSGILSIDKTNGLNENLYLSYNTSDNISVGIDGMIGKVKENKTLSVIGYLEAGNSSKGIIKDKLFFSAIVGAGYMENNLSDKITFVTAFAGTKFNYKPTFNFSTGIKSGYYVNKQKNALLANLFISYRF